MAAQDTAGLRLALEDYLVLAPVLLLPWAFGGVEIWAYRTAALSLVAAACVALWRRGWAGWGLDGGSRWLIPAFLLAAWAGAQIVPLPPSAIRLLSPEAYRLYSAAFPGYGSAPVADPLLALEQQALDRVPEASAFPPAEELSPPLALQPQSCLGQRWRTLSVQPSATQERLAWYVALLLGFLVLRERVADRRRWAAYRWALFGLCAALASFAFVQLQFWNHKLYWVRPMLVEVMPFGPYFNPTNLAGVMELGVPAMAGYAWGRLRRGGRAAVYEPGLGAAAVGTVLCLAAGFASASKMAALLLAASLFALGLLVAGTVRGRLAVVGAAILALACALIVLPGTRLGERLEGYLGRADEVLLLEGRFVVWSAARHTLADFPVTGAGFGTFGEVFPRYIPAGASARFSHAHNDYVELLVDGGPLAGLLVVWLAWGFGTRVLRAGRCRAPSPGRMGLAIGVVTLAVHAALDFNHQIPANALLWLACCALLLPWRAAGDAGAEP